MIIQHIRKLYLGLSIQEETEERVNGWINRRTIIYSTKLCENQTTSKRRPHCLPSDSINEVHFEYKESPRWPSREFSTFHYRVLFRGENKWKQNLFAATLLQSSLAPRGKEERADGWHWSRWDGKQVIRRSIEKFKPVQTRGLNRFGFFVARIRRLSRSSFPGFDAHHIGVIAETMGLWKLIQKWAWRWRAKWKHFEQCTDDYFIYCTNC